MAVLRDVPFISGWKTVASLTPFIAFLNTLEHDAPTDATGNITLGTVFRGAGVDELLGSYVSQYLLLPFDYGGLRVEQKYRVENDTAPSVTDEGWLAIQQGEDVTVAPRATEPAQYAASMRVLGSMVHKDPLFQFYYNAALISFGCGVTPVGLEMAAGDTDPKITAWTDGGGPDVLAAVRRAGPAAPRASAPAPRPTRRTPPRTSPCTCRWRTSRVAHCRRRGFTSGTCTCAFAPRCLRSGSSSARATQRSAPRSVSKSASIPYPMMSRSCSRSTTVSYC